MLELKFQMSKENVQFDELPTLKTEFDQDSPLTARRLRRRRQLEFDD